MIVSYSRRFIFIRTRKVASTSVEIFLSQFCSEEDIITPLAPGEETLRHNIQPRNFRIAGCGRARILRIFGELVGRPAIGHGGFYNHMPAREIRRLIGDKVWNDCYKISIERESRNGRCRFTIGTIAIATPSRASTVHPFAVPSEDFPKFRHLFHRWQDRRGPCLPLRVAGRGPRLRAQADRHRCSGRAAASERKLPRRAALARLLHAEDAGYHRRLVCTGDCCLWLSLLSRLFPCLNHR